MKNKDKKTQSSKNTTSTTSPSTDGLIAYTTPSSKSTVTIVNCHCKDDQHIGRIMSRAWSRTKNGQWSCIKNGQWSCTKNGQWYCPSCDQILCGQSVGASTEELMRYGYDDKLEGVRDQSEIKWTCNKCNVYVFEMNPVTSTALEMGLPMRIEEEHNEDSTRQGGRDPVQNSGVSVLRREGVLDNAQVNQGQVDQEEPEV